MPTGTTVHIRPAASGDTAETARVWQAGWLDGHLGHVPEELLAVRGPEYFTEQAAAWVDSTLLAVTPDGTVVGMVVVAGNELVQLAVDPRARRRGAGTALLRAAQDRISEHHDTAWLAVVPGNSRARDFYQRHGWTDSGPVIHAAPAGAGAVAETIPVPVHRYTIGLTNGRNPR
ncbi:N-acetyltransferase [Allokutzneria sp. NRRL B-24872]|uniref:GNAT family N-acetyltransferase n=1 Tax=Allokutzneria sp. NRRL B-24872 TaxID=1137961 RepID=UPI000A3805FD|nr:GNAT family N-acetyltransferase [Allokutzneria sp. NRRL B-24872]